MCGRYYIEIDDKELQDICDAVRQSSPEQCEQLEIKLSGEIFPADVVPVQTGAGRYQPMKWGFAGFDGRPVINARSETARSKPMFSEPMRSGRCLIPASGYYEWLNGGGCKTKYRFYIPGGPLFLAGCSRYEKGSPVGSFVILTREATGGAEAIHNRMPVIIDGAGRDMWFESGASATSFKCEELLFEPAV